MHNIASRINQLLRSSRPHVLGMLHLPALPGTPRNKLSVAEIGDQALQEAEVYMECGVDGMIIENMHDLPYVQGSCVGPEITSSAAVVALRLRSCYPNTPLGVQLLAGANRQALAVAHAAGLDFIRAECFVFSHVADEGLMHACAGELLRYRKNIGADNVAIFADIKKKHSAHSITSDVSLGETASAAQFFAADAVIVTGIETGNAASPRDVDEVKSCTPTLPVFVGSGVTAQNVNQYRNAQGLIVGSYFKENGNWSAPISKSRIAEFMDTVNSTFQ